MKKLKAIFNQGVDLIFGLLALGLLIWHMVDETKNFTFFLWLVVGYVIFNIICKVRYSLSKTEHPKEITMDKFLKQLTDYDK